MVDAGLDLDLHGHVGHVEALRQTSMYGIDGRVGIKDMLAMSRMAT